MRQAKTRTARNKPVKTRLKSEIKKVLVLSKTDKVAAQKALSEAYSVIDTAAKKHLIHKNNANRKKAMLSRAVARVEKAESK